MSHASAAVMPVFAFGVALKAKMGSPASSAEEEWNNTREFVAGTFGGFVGKIVEFPMDTVHADRLWLLEGYIVA